MRIAFLSDVHGNLSALDAALAELDRRGPFDAVIGGGDYVTRGPHNSEVVKRLRAAGWTAYLRGNGDNRVLNLGAQQGLVASPPIADAGGATSPMALHAFEQLDQEDLEFLATTELTWRTTGPSGQVLLCAHAAPDDPYRHIWPDAPEAEVNAMLWEAGADVYLYGHIHLSHVRRVEAGLTANAGTVGGPNRDQNIHPCFLLAEDTGTGWTLRHAAAPYDRDAYFHAIRHSTLPDPDRTIREHLAHQWEAGN